LAEENRLRNYVRAYARITNSGDFDRRNTNVKEYYKVRNLLISFYQNRR